MGNLTIRMKRRSTEEAVCFLLSGVWRFAKMFILVAMFFVISKRCEVNVFAYTETITTDGTITVDVIPSGSNANLGTDNLVVNSTCPLGYSVAIAGSSDNTLYKGGINTSSDTIDTSSGTPANPVSILGNNLGTWGYSLNSDITINSGFIGLTGIETQIASKASASASGGDTIPVHYGVSIASDQAPGSYALAESSQGAGDDAIVYYLITSPNCANYIVQYDDNGANSSTTMEITHDVLEDDEVTLAASNYKRNGYGFAGWSTVQLNPDSPNFQTDFATAVSDGKVFGPNETITADSNFLSQAISLNNQHYVTLYAVWVKPAQNANMQNWTGCGSLSNGGVIALTDVRDGNVYVVAKLADGNCWMTENLRLNSAANITSNDTNKPVNGFALMSSSVSDNRWCNSDNSTCYDQALLNTDNTLNTVSEMTDADENVYSYGNYYNWYSATAGNGTFASNSGNTVGDICPIGWHLPTSGGVSSDFGALHVALGGNGSKSDTNTNPTGEIMSNRYRAFPNNYLYSGIKGSRTTQYYSSTVYSGTAVYTQWIMDDGVIATDMNNPSMNHKGIGAPMRCVANASYEVVFNANGGTGTMQNQTIVVGDATALIPNGFTAPSGKVFGGWNTQSDGSGFAYDDEEVVTNIAVSGGTITLYAQWKARVYDTVASMTKGTQTAANLQATISSTNSGVYTYNSSAFGTSTDANNDYPIYYYRGVLDNTTGTYGSNGDGVAYPNYVKLDNTCWRIVRTTGSGGVKMIYNGTWTGSTCANATTAAQISSPVTTSTFNGAANTQADARQVVRVGYTHNSTYANTSVTGSTAYTTVFGSNTNIVVNDSDSTIKSNVETWFNNNLSEFSGILETNAGYCNDRTPYSTETGTGGVANIRPYTTSTNTGTGYVAYFAAQHRNATNVQTPSLGCPTARNVVDVYSSDTSNGGNGLLGAPVGLLTADEASFAGSGSNTATNGSAYNDHSFLRTGSNYWTMSPYNRTGSFAYNFYLNTNGYLQNGRIDTAYGIRPVISLVHDTYIGDGSGTAVDPWTIKLDGYTVKFDANGGTGTMGDQTIYSGLATAINSNTFIPPTKKIFKGWNTKADGTGVGYNNGQVVTDLATPGKTITLYAQWGELVIYDMVASMSKGIQTAADLKEVITTTNSGVFEYNSSAFGTADDAGSSHAIYYYRGILDSNLDNTNTTYGSNGDGVYYPNYVRLGNTCWRIFRTTGSGGVKMIYNGLYSGGTTANSCANATTNAQITTLGFGSQAGSSQTTWYNNLARAGYTYNASVDDITASTSMDTILGSSSNFASTNTTDSYIKNYIENTWFNGANGVSAYESILEPDAGYCNDRSIYSNEAGSTAATTAPPYIASNATALYFGPYTRHKVANKTITLSCPRGTVDIYSTSVATSGNKQLSKPVALLTTDEAALSGNGYNDRTTTTTYSSTYSYSSFLRSGSIFWTFSPRYRRSNNGNVRGYVITADGSMSGETLGDAYGLRPVITLEAGTVASGGTGVATDPWIVDAP